MVKDILDFLKDIAQNNRRDWFLENRARYEQAKSEFVNIAEQTIERIGRFDPEVAGMPVQSTLYRFHRDTRFSLDKSPYKRHFGTYINPRGKKSPHGGYYLHLEPGNCMIAGGAYCLEPVFLKNVRKHIVEHIDEFIEIVENPEFKKLFPVIGETHLKKLPIGFSKDFPYPQYLRPKDYSVFTPLADDYFLQKDWLDDAAEKFHAMKPFLDFVNEPIDDILP